MSAHDDEVGNDEGPAKPRPRPAWSILNPRRHYVNADNTDLRRTFAKVKARQERDDAWADFKRELETRAKSE